MVDPRRHFLNKIEKTVKKELSPNKKKPKSDKTDIVGKSDIKRSNSAHTKVAGSSMKSRSVVESIDFFLDRYSD